MLENLILCSKTYYSQLHLTKHKNKNTQVVYTQYNIDSYNSIYNRIKNKNIQTISNILFIINVYDTNKFKLTNNNNYIYFTPSAITNLDEIVKFLNKLSLENEGIVFDFLFIDDKLNNFSLDFKPIMDNFLSKNISVNIFNYISTQNDKRIFLNKYIALNDMTLKQITTYSVNNLISNRIKPEHKLDNNSDNNTDNHIKYVDSMITDISNNIDHKTVTPDTITISDQYLCKNEFAGCKLNNIRKVVCDGDRMYGGACLYNIINPLYVIPRTKFFMAMNRDNTIFLWGNINREIKNVDNYIRLFKWNIILNNKKNFCVFNDNDKNTKQYKNINPIHSDFFNILTEKTTEDVETLIKQSIKEKLLCKLHGLLKHKC